MYKTFFCNSGLIGNRDDEFQNEMKENKVINEMGEFFPCSDIDPEDYLACDSNVDLWRPKCRLLCSYYHLSRPRKHGLDAKIVFIVNLIGFYQVKSG